MKRNWQDTELARHFSLHFDEFELIANKTGPTRLGFAVLLKFFQYEGRFPNTKNEVPRSIISYLAPQLDVEAEAYMQYDWLGHAIKYHRTQIRQFLGFRQFTVLDFKQTSQWLTETTVSHEQRSEVLKALVYQHWRELKIEPPSADQLERLVRSVLHTYEESCFAQIFQQLPEAVRKELDSLLDPKLDAAVSEDSTTLSADKPQVAPDPVDFQDLKHDPAGATLKSVLKETAKLKALRKIELPKDLFKALTPRQLLLYRNRAAVEISQELRRHPPAIRYSLLAAFCFLRQQEITDNLVELLIQIIHRIGAKAERRVDKEIIADFKRVDGKPNLLFLVASASLAKPDQPVREVVYPAVSEQTGCYFAPWRLLL